MLKYRSLVIVIAMILMFSSNILSQDQTKTTDKKRTNTQTQPRVKNQKQGQQQVQQQNKSDLKTTMEKMHSQMMNSGKTGDFDKDFAQLMSEHHKGAIEMSQQVVQNGKNQEIKDLANKVIEENRTDLEKLSKYDNNNSSNNQGMPNKKKENVSDKNMMGNDLRPMMEQTINLKETGNLDKDYASFMILHHKESIKLSQDYLNRNKKGEFANLAQNIIKNSKNDISKLEKFASNDQMTTRDRDRDRDNDRNRDMKKKTNDRNTREEKQEVK